MGHNIVAHHHHDSLSPQQSHHHHNSGNEEHPESNFLEVFYSGLAHTGSHVVYSTADISFITHIKKDQNFDLQFIFVKWNWKSKYGLASKLKIHNKDPDLYLSTYDISLHLRGPPHFIA